MNTLMTSRSLRSFVAAAMLGAIPAGFAATASASDLTDVRSVTVQYADLNLSSPQGAATLYRRIVWAAREVCGMDDDDFDLAARQDARDCFGKTVADAVMKVGHPELIAVYNAKTHRSIPTRVASAR